MMEAYISLSHWGLHGTGISPQYAAELGRQLDELEAENAALRKAMIDEMVLEASINYLAEPHYDDFTVYHG